MRNLEDRISVFLLAIFCLILYFNSLWNVFVFDDLHSIQGNLYIKGWRYIPLLFKGYYTSVPDVPKGMFRPILLLTFAFNYLSSRLNPLGYHIINILLHFLNGVLLYSLIRFLKKDLNFGLAIFISLLFIAHPINTETVTYISCRSDLLVTFLILCAFLSYAYSRFLLPGLLYILALLTKETALIFPFLVLAYDFMRPSASDYTDSKGITQIKHRHIFYIVLIGISLSYWIYRGFIFGSSANILAPLSSPIRSLWSNILTQSAVTLFYLRLFLWPHPLNLHHVFPELNSLFEPLVFISALATVIMTTLFFLLRKRQPLISLGIAWYLICLIPKFYAILNFPAMEHHFYLPSIGIYFILAKGLERFYLKFRRQFIYIAFGIIGIFTVLVWFRNYEWKDSLRFYKITIKRDPYSAVAHNNLGIEYARLGLAEAAEEEFRKALSLSNSVDVQINCRINLARIYSKQKRTKEAIDELNKALRIKSNYDKIYQACGAVYAEMNEKEKAEEVWKKGLSFNPQATGILDNLGLLCLERKQLKEAREYFQAAIKSQPDDFIGYFGLGQVLEQESDIEFAIQAYEKSVQLNPSYALAHYSLGTLYAVRQDRHALWHLKEAVRLAPSLAEGHNNLAVLYASMEPPQLELARQHAQKALALGYKVDEKFLKIIDLPLNR